MLEKETMNLFDYDGLDAKPFLKWVGGKRQLLDELKDRLPSKVKKTKKIDKYVEPFVGGGAMFFFLKNNFDVKESVICDINRELIIGYKTIKNDPQKLIEKLNDIEDEYLSLGRENDGRKDFYYKIRDLYNEEMLEFDYDNYNEEWIERAKYLIFLNKTCFNGMFRQNKKGEFNVPHGRYANPTICDSENILEVSKALQDTKILCGNFTKTGDHIDEDTLVYFDPPYRPLDDTSNFTGYFKGGFDDKDQKKLAQFFSEMDKKGADLILSNSDPKNTDPEDDFFEELYDGYKIDRVQAKRSINSKGSKRGAINELMITNPSSDEDYSVEKFLKTLLKTNKEYDYFVNWDKIKDNLNKYKVEINILNSLIRSENFDEELEYILRKYSEVLPVIPILIAIREEELTIIKESLESFLKSDSNTIKYGEYNFEKRELSEEEIEKFICFFNEIGLKDFFTNISCSSLWDYITGIEVGLDTKVRKNRNNQAIESALEPILNEIIEEINEEDNTSWELIKQKKFKSLEHRLGTSITPSIRNKKADFILINDNNKVLNIETDFFIDEDSNLQEVVSSYINHQSNLKENSFKFIWVSDGHGWLKQKNQAKEVFDKIDHVINLEFVRGGALKEIIKEI